MPDAKWLNTHHHCILLCIWDVFWKYSPPWLWNSRTFHLSPNRRGDSIHRSARDYCLKNSVRQKTRCIHSYNQDILWNRNHQEIQIPISSKEQLSSQTNNSLVPRWKPPAVRHSLCPCVCVLGDNCQRHPPVDEVARDILKGMVYNYKPIFPLLKIRSPILLS